MQTTQQNINYAQPDLLAFDICRIEMSDLKEFVAIAFKEDIKLLRQYSSYSTMEELISTQVDNIVEFAKTKDVKCYGLFLEQTPIGFTVVSEKLLHSFGINIYCRQKEVKAIWLNWIKRLFENNFVVCLCRENTRAINYFLKNGLEKFSEDGNIVYLITSKI